MACGILVPWPRIELVSPALLGGFLTTGPPGKSLRFYKGLLFVALLLPSLIRASALLLSQVETSSPWQAAEASLSHKGYQQQIWTQVTGPLNMTLPHKLFELSHSHLYKTNSILCITGLGGFNEVCMSAQWCLTLRDPLYSSLPGSSVHGIFQAKMLEWVAVLLQGIFPTHGMNQHHLCLLYCSQFLYPLHHQGSSEFNEEKYINHLHP